MLLNRRAGRQVVSEPLAGEVVGLKIAGVGAIVGPRNSILDIVPRTTSLIVEARSHLRRKLQPTGGAGGDESNASRRLRVELLYTSPPTGRRNRNARAQRTEDSERGLWIHVDALAAVDAQASAIETAQKT